MTERGKKGLAFCISLITYVIILHSQLEQVYQPSQHAFASAKSIPTNNFDGIVTSIIDGDTLDIVTNDGNSITVRLVLVDAPERNELGYNGAKDFVTQNCLDKPAIIDPDNNQDLSICSLTGFQSNNTFKIESIERS